MEIGGVEDHVHVFCRLAKTQAPCDLIKTLQQASTTWAKQTRASLSRFYWQRGYGAFSIRPGYAEDLRRYILNQEQHHKSVSFQDESRRLCQGTWGFVCSALPRFLDPRALLCCRVAASETPSNETGTGPVMDEKGVMVSFLDMPRPARHAPVGYVYHVLRACPKTCRRPGPIPNGVVVFG